jgi:hypothetical protein
MVTLYLVTIMIFKNCGGGKVMSKKEFGIVCFVITPVWFERKRAQKTKKYITVQNKRTHSKAITAFLISACTEQNEAQ